jgi:chromatin remodeling complex protein RSC6
MARKTSVKAQQPESESQSNKVAVEQTNVVADTKATTATTTAPKKKRTTKPKETAPTQEVASLPVVKEEAVAEKKQRVAPTKDSVLESFQSIIDSIDSEIEAIRSDGTGKGGVGSVKFLRAMAKQIKVLRAQSARVIGKRGGSRKKSDPDAVPNTSSGFLKPVEISKEIAKFAGWGPTDKKSRVDVTKYLCNYIKDNNLQNVEDRRQIKPDPKLSKLLGYDEKSSASPLTYFHLQKLLKPHFPKAVVAVA